MNIKDYNQYTMKKTFILLAVAMLLFSCSSTTKMVKLVSAEKVKAGYDDYFTGMTMRYDFHHAGNSSEETYYFDKLMREGEWAGSRVSLINPFDYGEQHFRIVDNAANDISQYISYFFHIPHQIFSLIKLHINSKFILTGICSNCQVVE